MCAEGEGIRENNRTLSLLGHGNSLVGGGTSKPVRVGSGRNPKKSYVKGKEDGQSRFGGG